MESFFKISGIIAWLLLLVSVLIKAFLPNLVFKISKTLILGTNLEKAIVKFLKEYPKNLTKETTGGLLAAIIIRLTRIGLLTILISIIPFILLYQQNQLLKVQNEKFDRQNDLIVEQNNWINEQTSLSKKANEYMSTQIELVNDQNRLIQKESELLSQQNFLAREQNKYSVSTDKPDLGVKTSGASVFIENDTLKMESSIKIENFGKRRASETRWLSKIIELRNNRCNELFSEPYTSNNPIFSGQQVSYVHFFDILNETSKYYLYIKIEYLDILEDDKRKFIELFYRYPSVDQIRRSVNKELGLFNASEDEIKLINECL